MNLSDRYELLCLLMDKEIEIMRFKKDLQQKVKTHVDKNQQGIPAAGGAEGDPGGVRRG